MSGWRARTLGAALLLLAGLGLAGRAAATTVSAPLTVSAAATVGGSAPLGPSDQIDGLACPLSATCLAIDAGGDVLVGFPGAATWTHDLVDVARRLTAVSCPTASLCLVADDAGRVLRSTTPTTPHAAWSTATVSSDVVGLACPDAGDCLALDASGAASVSHDGGLTWLPSASVGSASALSCASLELCAAVGDGEVRTSTDAFGSAPLWQASAVPTTGRLLAVTCVSSGDCLASDNMGDVFTSPAAATRVWTAANVDGGNWLPSLACSDAGCVAADSWGRVLASADPFGGGPWTTSSVAVTGQTNYPQAAVCDGVMCLVGNQSGQLLSTADAFTASRWNAITIDAVNAINSVTCPTATFCAVADDGGHVSTSPGPHGPWTTREVDPGQWLTRIVCTSSTSCVAEDGAGGVLTLSLGTWTRQLVDPGQTLWGLTCPTSTECLASDGAGGIEVGTGVSTASVSWSRVQVESQTVLWAVACPSTALCVATDENGKVLTSLTPTVAASWVSVHVGSAGIGALSCSATTRCMIGDGAGELFSASAPASGPWTKVAQDPGQWIAAVSCSSALCVATDNGGRVLSSANSWTPQAAAPHEVVWDASCVATTCLTGTSAGTVFLVAQTAAATPEPAPVVSKPAPVATPRPKRTPILLTLKRLLAVLRAQLKQ